MNPSLHSKCYRRGGVRGGGGVEKEGVGVEKLKSEKK